MIRIIFCLFVCFVCLFAFFFGGGGWLVAYFDIFLKSSCKFYLDTKNLSSSRGTVNFLYMYLLLLT